MRQMSGTTVLGQLLYNPRLVLEYFKNSSTKLNETNVWNNSSRTALVQLGHFKNSFTNLNEINVWKNSSCTALKQYYNCQDN